MNTQDLLKARESYLDSIRCELMGPGSEVSIPDKEHEITDEEKLATIEYLKQHHLVSKNGVIDSKVYNIAIKRYLAGTLFTEEEKDKIKNKY